MLLAASIESWQLAPTQSLSTSPFFSFPPKLHPGPSLSLSLFQSQPASIASLLRLRRYPIVLEMSVAASRLLKIAEITVQALQTLGQLEVENR